MNVTKLFGKITNMRYQSFLKRPLPTASFDSDVNDWQSKCCVKDNNTVYAVSKWTGPKRSRTYPFASVYDTLSACGGKDDVIIRNNRYELIESKHSKKTALPSENDIKEGLIKMLLFSNIDELYEDSKRAINFIPVLRLTSEKIHGKITTNIDDIEIKAFFKRNNFRENREKLVNTLFNEARANNFEVIIEYGRVEKDG